MGLLLGRFCYLLTLHFLVSGYALFSTVDAVGINYGQIANNLPSPANVVPLVKSIGASRVKLYDADPKVLRAFANTGVEFIVGLGNEDLAKMRDSDQAIAWVKTNVQAYMPATKITCITIGNEVLTFNDTALSDELFPAMCSIHKALVTLGLDKCVSVASAHSLAVLETSYPPSSGRFRRDLVPCITPILKFHTETGSPLLINAYPYFAFKGSPKHISLDYVLFQPNEGVVDSGNSLRYENMLHAQIDAVYAALAALGYKNLPVQISETGWPSKGDGDEAGATLENAQKYNGNLFKLKKGTPLKPDSDLNVFVFALFNENMKPGPVSERNYGLFKADGTPAYSLGFSGSSTHKNSTTSGSSGGPPSISILPLSPPDNSYLAYSSSPEKYSSAGPFTRIFICCTIAITMLKNTS